MGRGVHPAPHQHLGQKGHPPYTSGHKHGDNFCLQRAEKRQWKRSSLLGLLRMPGLFTELPRRGRESKKKKKTKPKWFMRAGGFVCLDNEPTAGPGTAPRPLTIASVCALFPARSAISWGVHRAQQYPVMMARVKYHLHGRTKGQDNFIWGQTAGLYNSSFHRAFSFQCVPVKKLFLVS